MSLSTRTAGVTLATAAAAMFAVGVAMTPVAGHSAENVKCFGVNSCKGQSACKSATNECKGLNSCKGKGFISTTKSDCDAKGGKVG